MPILMASGNNVQEKTSKYKTGTSQIIRDVKVLVSSILNTSD